MIDHNASNDLLWQIVGDHLQSRILVNHTVEFTVKFTVTRNTGANLEYSTPRIIKMEDMKP